MLYEVAVKEVHITFINVEASSEEEAKIEAKKILISEELPNGKYDYTISENEWEVREIDFSI